MSLPLVYHPDYVTPMPDGHRFPMPKFGKIYECLIKDGIATLDQFYCPQMATPEAIRLAHTPTYINAYQMGTLDNTAMRRIGLPWSSALVTRTRTAVGGTLLTARLALEYGLACNTAGGTHHAFPDYGSGFCIFNDLAVAARFIQLDSNIERILIVDLDVHQGDGTACIFENDPTVFTFSMHCEKNFPLRKRQSDLDIPLPTGMDDIAYLQALEDYLEDLLDQFKPELIFYDAGVDPHINDRLGKLELTDNGLYKRDIFVLEQCAKKAIPVACVVGGGYDKDVERLARRHCLMHRAASEIFVQYKY